MDQPVKKRHPRVSLAKAGHGRPGTGDRDHADFRPRYPWRLALAAVAAWALVGAAACAVTGATGWAIRLLVLACACGAMIWLSVRFRGKNRRG